MSRYSLGLCEGGGDVKEMSSASMGVVETAPGVVGVEGESFKDGLGGGSKLVEADGEMSSLRESVGSSSGEEVDPRGDEYVPSLMLTLWILMLEMLGDLMTGAPDSLRKEKLIWGMSSAASRPET